MLSLRQISSKYDITMRSLYKATHAKEFPYFRTAPQKGRIYVKEEDFLKWLTRNRVPSVSEIKQGSV